MRKYDIPPPDLDLASAAGGEWFAEHMKQAASEIFNDRGKVHAMAVLIARRDPKTRLSYKRPRLYPCLLVGDGEGPARQEKRDLMAEVRKIAKRTDALAGGMMTEAWAAPSLTQAEYRREWDGRLGEYPDRRELLLVSWQHRATGLGGAIAYIHRDGGKPVLDEWEDVPVDGGLMVEILPEGDQ